MIPPCPLCEFLTYCYTEIHREYTESHRVRQNRSLDFFNAPDLKLNPFGDSYYILTLYIFGKNILLYNPGRLSFILNE